jgi:hypothetical protein
VTLGGQEIARFFRRRCCFGFAIPLWGDTLEANLSPKNRFRMKSSGPYRGARLKRIVAWIALLTIAMGLRVGLAIHFPNVFHPDEIFQTLEPAHRLVYGYGVTTWEWREGVRSWVFPAFLAGVMRATGWMGSGAVGYTYGIIFVLSLASLSTVWFGFAWAKRASGMEAAVIAAGACSVYLGLVYFAPKALTEVAATDVLLPGLYLGVYGDRSNERKRLILAGILCGIAACLRIQLIPAIVFAAIYFCYPRWRRRIPAVVAGFSLPVLAFGLVDKITWSYPWQSSIRNFQVNVLEGRSQVYGVQPWYWYLPVLLGLLGPAVLFIVQGALRSPFLAAVSLIILGSHSLLNHKEIRFMYPVLPLAITLAAIGFVESATLIRTNLKLAEYSKTVIAVGLLFFVLSSAYIASILPGLWKAPGAQLALDRLSRDSTLCGVGFYGVNWWDISGYTHLHRNVPIVPVMDSADFARMTPTFNALIAPSATPEAPADFKKSNCWNEICLYRRAGACKAPQPEDTLDGFLRRTGN